MSSSRRKFIATSAKAGLGTLLASQAISGVLSSCTTTKKVTGPASFKTGFDQQPLPYTYNALEPWIDTETMDIHYNKHAAAYSKNLKEAAKAEGIDANSSLEDIFPKINQYSMKLRNNAGGHYNHEFFWKLLKPNTAPGESSNLYKAIVAQFGSLDKLKEKFNDAAKSRFGSGWAWLVYTKDKQLVVCSTANQDNPLMGLSGTDKDPFISGFPIFGLDVWEHAYYLKYRNRRAEYVENFWKILNWPYIQERFDAVR